MGVVEAFVMLGVLGYLMIAIIFACALTILFLVACKMIADVAWEGAAFLKKHAAIPLDILF